MTEETVTPETPAPATTEEFQAFGDAEVQEFLAGRTKAPEVTTPEEPTPEPEAVTPEAKPEPKVAKRFEELSRREKALVAREKTIKASEATNKSIESLKARAKSDPDKVIEELGIDYTDLVLKKAGAKRGDFETVEQKLTRLENELRTRDEASNVRAQEQQVEQLYQWAGSQIAANSEKYEFLSITPDANQLIVETMSHHFTATGQVLSFEDAAQAMEEELESRVQSQKIFGTKKFRSMAKSLLGELEDEETPVKVIPKPAPKTASKTLSNGSGKGGVPIKVPPANESLEAKRERLAAQLAAFRIE